MPGPTLHYPPELKQNPVWLPSRSGGGSSEGEEKVSQPTSVRNCETPSGEQDPQAREGPPENAAVGSTGEREAILQVVEDVHSPPGIWLPIDESLSCY